MKKLIDFILSKKFRNAVLFIFFTFFMTSAISSQNYFFQKVIENGISKRDIIAQRDIKVIDTRKTELHKKEVAQAVEPILTQAEDDFIVSSLDTLQKSIIKIKEKDASNAVKTDEIKMLFDETPEWNFTDYLLSTSTTELNSLFDRAKLTLSGVLNTGISAHDFESNNVKNIIKKHIPVTAPYNQKSHIVTLLHQVIVPNLVVDEFATEIAKKNAQNSVKPYEVVFKQGQKIVFEGEPVTKLKSDALREAGYNILEVNFQGLAGIYLLVVLFTFIFIIYERNFEKQYYNARHMTIIGTLTMLMAMIAAILPTGFSPYIMPFPAYTILISIFTTPRNAFFVSSILLGMLSMGMHYSPEIIVSFLLLNTVVMTSVAKLKFSKRSDMLLISVKIALVGIFIVGGIYFIESNMMSIDNQMIIQDLGYIIFNCFIISGILLLGALPIIENLFGVMTPYGLAELADSKLLKRLLQDAPGTYNHSLIVSQLAEAAAEAIEANPILARVGAMYHDIGKLLRPMFFVENQSFYGIENPHKSCTPRFSKMLITAHPKDGLELAKEYHLPQIISNFIIQHHGTSLVSYFYNEALKEEGADNVNEEQFRYAGPKPNMKETAILMIADAVESAVRAAKNPSSEEIDEIINKIIKERLNDEQLSDSPLTLKDLKTIAETFSRMLRGMHHKRIKYHDELVRELDKNKANNHSANVANSVLPVLDSDLDSKIKELESKKNDNN
ncbi:MAG: HDIG domain-containing protein [bacterium]|nr:HDIG domain-containing protein [bacterium]